MKALTLDVKLEARSRRSLREGWLLALADLAVVSTCYLAALVLHRLAHGVVPREAVVLWPLDTADERLLWYFGLSLACVLSFQRFGHYARRRPFWHEVGDIAGVALTLAVVDAALVFLTDTAFSRAALVANWALVALFVPVSRAGLKHTLMRAGAWRRPTVVVGLGPNALDTAAALASEPLLGLEVVAFVEPPRDDAPASELVAAAGQSDDLPTPVRLDDGRHVPVLRPGLFPNLLPEDLGRPHVVVALEMDQMARCGDFVEQVSRYYGDVDIASPMRGLPLVGAQATHYFGHDVLTLRLYNNLARPWPRVVKRAFDLVAASALLVLAAPLFAVIAWRVRSEGDGPVFYGHQRVGCNGRPFTCYKFRSMVANADEMLAQILDADPRARAEWERDHKLQHDPRVTRIGHWLRKTSLDELPQLWNVLRGEMSLVGPRPIVREELSRYGRHAAYYTEGKPGMTGLWQISGRSDLDYRRRVRLDCWYVKNWTVWYDILILLRTGRVVLQRQGAR